MILTLANWLNVIETLQHVPSQNNLCVTRPFWQLCIEIKFALIKTLKTAVNSGQRGHKNNQYLRQFGES